MNVNSVLGAVDHIVGRCPVHQTDFPWGQPCGQKKVSEPHSNTGSVWAHADLSLGGTAFCMT